MTGYPQIDGTQACANATTAVQWSFDGTADPATAVALCSSCSFIQPCRSFALEHDTSGVWGGMTEEDRRQWRRSRRMREPHTITVDIDGLIEEGHTRTLEAAL